MDRRLAFVILVCLFTRLGWSVEFFGGLTELINYESSLPCEDAAKTKCAATNGVMGLTLDTASGAGLNISSILIQDKKNIFVKTKQFGTCLVDTQSKNQIGNVSFRCSSKGLAKGKLQGIDKVFTLTKKSEDNFTLLDVTNSQKVKGRL